ncbi:MAG: hypothetical protein JHC61_15490 [Burkholderiaceae bacterium]|nr:hypothetical protein [Burkholderiaceae bacterium]
MLASYTFQAGPYGMAAVGLFSMLPGIVLAKHLGRICDGANPQKIVLISLIVRILATLGICITSHLLLFLILVAIRSAGNSTTPIAINVISVRAIPQRFIRKFYAQQNILGNVAKVLSPSLGAILVGMHGQNGPLLLAATLCSISLALFFFLRLN